jgi:hypothetical protein
MTEDERRATAFGWDEWRVVSAYESALASIKGNDMAAAYRIVNKTPKGLRPNVRFRLIYKISPDKYPDLILENLEEIRKELGALEIPAKNAAGDYLALSALYLKSQPTEAESCFRTAVKYINKTDAENPDFLPEKDYAPLQDYVPLTADLLKIDEYSIYASLNNISSRRSRTRLRLGLLESALQKLTEAKKRVELEQKERTKDSKNSEKN